MRRLLFAALLCLPVTVAQDAVPTDPLRLAELLIGEGDAVTFYPDALPPDVTLPLPDDARLQGSITIGSEQAEIVLEVDVDGPNWFDDSTRRVGETLGANGWRGYDTYGPTVFAVAGQHRDRVLNEYCSPDGTQSASLEPSRLSSRTSLVIVRLYDFCGDDQDMGLPLPNLILPQGVDLGGSGMSGGSDGFVVTARFDTGLAPQNIFGNLARQLTTQQWQVEKSEQMTDGLRAAVTVEHNGFVWQGTLTVAETRAVLEVARAR